MEKEIVISKQDYNKYFRKNIITKFEWEKYLLIKTMEKNGM